MDRRLFATLLLCACSPWLRASPFQHGLEVTAGSQYDSNPRMSATQPEGVWTHHVRPVYRIKRVVDNDTWSASAQVEVERNSDQRLRIDREDPALELGWSRENPYGHVAVKANYDQQSASATESDNPDAASSNDTRTHYGAGAEVVRALSERNELTLNLDHEQNSYQGAQGGTSSFNDYQLTTAMARLEHLLSERNRLYVKGGSSHYLPQSPNPSATQYQLQLGVKSELSPTWKLDASAGVEQVESADDQTSGVGGVELSHEGERTRTSFSAVRSSSPSGSNGFTQSDQLTAKLEYDLNARTILGAQASYSKTYSTSPSTLDGIRLYLDRQLQEELTATAAYEYNQQQSQGQTAEGSVWSMSLKYDIPEL